MADLLPKNDALRFVLQYGGRCRECADNLGICPNTGLPCAEPAKAIQWVIGAINYGVGMGYLTVNKPTSPPTRGASTDSGSGG